MDGWRVPLDERRGYIGGSNVRRAVRNRWRTCTSRYGVECGAEQRHRRRGNSAQGVTWGEKKVHRERQAGL